MKPEKQTAVERWKIGAIEELAAARSLLVAGHYRQCLFWSHLAAEKTLKAHLVSRGVEPPRIHSLRRLAFLAEIELEPSQAMILDQLNGYQQIARYDDSAGSSVFILPEETTRELLEAAEEIVQWLIEKL